MKNKKIKCGEYSHTRLYSFNKIYGYEILEKQSGRIRDEI